MKLYLITHASTRQDCTVDSTQWHLSERGETEAALLHKHELWNDVDCVILSNEPKTRLTVAAVIQERNLPIWLEGRFNELRRGGWVENYNGQVAQVFATPNQGVGGWEPAAVARDRFLDGITLLRKRFINENLALVGHGLIFSIYRAYLLGKPRVDMAEWQQLGSASVAQVNPISERLIQDFVPIADYFQRGG